jgi:hypothetical protein
LLNALAALSLILCVATVIVWVRSHRLQDEWYRIAFVGERHSSQWSKVLSRNGVIAFAREAPALRRYYEMPVRPGEWIHRTAPAPNLSLAASLIWKPTLANRMGFIYHRGRQTQMELAQPPFVPSTVFALPYFAVTVVLAFVPGVLAVGWMGRRRSRMRAARGQCARCAYDLRATPESCPECGTIPGR